MVGVSYDSERQQYLDDDDNAPPWEVGEITPYSAAPNHWFLINYLAQHSHAKAVVVSEQSDITQNIEEWFGDVSLQTHTVGVDASDIRRVLASVSEDFEPYTGENSIGKRDGYISLNQLLNLSAIAIGLGLERIRYEPEEFRGLIYWPESYENAFCVVFTTGEVFVMGCETKKEIRAIATFVVSRFRELGLLERVEVGFEDFHYTLA